MTVRVFVLWQFKLENARLRSRPARGNLKINDVEVIEVPAMTSFAHAGYLWWGDKHDAADDREAKALYNRIDRERLPDKTIVPAFPGSAGCREQWIAFRQEFVHEYNNGSLPESYLSVGKWPDEVNELRVWPGLARVAKQLPKLLSTLRAAAPWQPRPSAAGSPLPSLCRLVCDAGDGEVEQARLDFALEADLEPGPSEATPSATGEMSEQAEVFVDLGVSEEPPTVATPSDPAEGAAEVTQVDAGAGADGTPAAAPPAEAAPNEAMSGAEALLGLLGAPGARAGATPAAGHSTAADGAEEEEEMVQVGNLWYYPSALAAQPKSDKAADTDASAADEAAADAAADEAAADADADEAAPDAAQRGVRARDSASASHTASTARRACDGASTSFLRVGAVGAVRKPGRPAPTSTAEHRAADAPAPADAACCFAVCLAPANRSKSLRECDQCTNKFHHMCADHAGCPEDKRLCARCLGTAEYQPAAPALAAAAPAVAAPAASAAPIQPPAAKPAEQSASAKRAAPAAKPVAPSRATRSSDADAASKPASRPSSRPADDDSGNGSGAGSGSGSDSGSGSGSDSDSDSDSGRGRARRATAQRREPPPVGSYIRVGKKVGRVVEEGAKVEWEVEEGDPVEAAHLEGPRAWKWSLVPEEDVAKGMAVRSGLGAVERAHGRPLPPPEQLQLDKMQLVAVLPNADVLGNSAARGLGAGQLALYASGYADGACFFRAGDLICHHRGLDSGGLSRLSEAHVGFLAVPVQPLPRLGAAAAARSATDLQQISAAKFLVWRCKVVNITPNHAPAAPKELRFVSGGGAGSKLDLGELDSITRSVIPYDPARVRVVRTPPPLAAELYGGFTAHICAALAAETLLQHLRDRELLRLQTLAEVEAAFTPPEAATADASARAAAVLHGAVQNVAASKKRQFASVPGASKATQADLVKQFQREADSAKLVVAQLFAPRSSTLGDLDAELTAAKKASLPPFLELENAVPPPQNAISGAAAAAGAAAKKVKEAGAADAAAKAKAAPKLAPKPAPKPKRQAAAAAAAASTPPPSKVARSAEAPSSACATQEQVLLRSALSGDGSAAEQLVSRLQLSGATSSSEHAAEVGGLKARIEVLERENATLKEGSGKKDEKILALTGENAALKGQLAEMTVDKRTLGELKGSLDASKSEISTAKAQVAFLQDMLTKQLAQPAQPERPSHPPPPSYPYPPPPYPPPQYPWHPPQPPSQPPGQPPPAAAPAPVPTPAPAEPPAAAPPSHHAYPYGYPPQPWPWPHGGYAHQPR